MELNKNINDNNVLEIRIYIHTYVHIYVEKWKQFSTKFVKWQLFQNNLLRGYKKSFITSDYKLLNYKNRRVIRNCLNFIVYKFINIIVWYILYIRNIEYQSNVDIN